MQNISPIRFRILKYLENKGISKYKFYKETGVSRGILDKNGGISEDNVAKYIAYYADVSEIWLLTGKGEMLKREINTNILEEPAEKYGQKEDCSKLRLQFDIAKETIYEQKSEIRSLTKEVGVLEDRLLRLKKEYHK